ncbi:hypothetical protein SUGI_0424800 [Cryptomeria japonica]|uniref:heavy metal-associated isoprenylated plant protein 30 n=1 Tax=Cryptomeria japonica TaxID=3369 RepID=UPI002408B94E|nr:heavy metal-associated isoprenylated plant protein 30 [Cryptomeria japonica]XP_059074683.1 heavy metal-associated isoprenylated plant protein 30 [Cryptomeria japonica]GLJ22568.1 hypothetical protein SUGI_0424800 [Cryptomeria japonica]
MQTVELKVEMVGYNCEQKIKRSIAKLKGIEKVEVDVNYGKVVVTGSAHPNKVLKAVRRGGLKADFWSSRSEALLSTYAAGSYYCLRVNGASQSS